MSLDTLFSTTQRVSEIIGAVLTTLRPYQRYPLIVSVACAVTWAFLRWLRASRRRSRTTQLRGPPSESFIYGVSKNIFNPEESGAVYEAWAKEYGAVYSVPATLGSTRIILCDPKAIAHFYSKESWTYDLTPFTRIGLTKLLGKGMTTASGEDYRRQRKALAPGLSIVAIRRLTSIFYDSVYKVKSAWDITIESSGGDTTIIDVQSWMNRISLDAIGLAGFSHDFCALEGKRSCVADVFNAFSETSPTATLDNLMDLLGLIFPLLARVPTSRMRLYDKLNATMEEIFGVLLARIQKEKEMGVVGDKEGSVIGLLIKETNADSGSHLTKEEATSQMKTLLMAGYETTSVSLAWALLELSRNPEVQTKLRNELLGHGTDPTYDQLASGLPYLDAVVHEILRIHPAVFEFTRVATEDDVIPLSEAVFTNSGELVNSLTIAKGTLVAVPGPSVNRSVAVWGDDAKEFRPSRWLEYAQGQNGIPAKAKEVQGHRHLLSFVDGPRMCLGRHFAIAQMKVVLAVLVKNFVFELRDGVDSKIEFGRSLLLRPKIAGEVGCRLPMRVKSYVV